jgi:soluble lytic murein transglycosylase-like protein
MDFARVSLAARGSNGRRLVAPLATLVLLTLSCAVAPVAQPVVELSVPVASVPVPKADDPAVATVLAHLRRHQARTGLTDREVEQLAQTVVMEARRYRFDPALVLAVIHVESRYDTYAVSPKDALGLMQLLPSTGAWLAPRVGVEWRGPQTLFDPIANVRLGVAYLRQLTDRYDGSVRTALVAYNWGPGRIDAFVAAGDPLPSEYSQLVLAAYGRRSS